MAKNANSGIMKNIGLSSGEGMLKIWKKEVIKVVAGLIEAKEEMKEPIDAFAALNAKRTA